MKIHCPQCGVRGSVDDTYLGKKVKCPKCDQIFLLKPEMGRDAEPAVAADVSKQSPTQPVVSTDEGSAEWAEEREELWPAESVPEPASSDIKDDIGAEETDDDFSIEPIPAPSPQKQPDDSLDQSQKTVAEQAEALIQTDLADTDDDLLIPLEDFADNKDDGRAPAPESADYADSADSAGPPVTDQGDDIPETALEIEDEPYGVSNEQCWQCGKMDSVGEPFIAKDGRLYCTECFPQDADEEQEEPEEAVPHVAQQATADGGEEQVAAATDAGYLRLSIGDTLRESWSKARGVKGTIWAGTAIMYLFLLLVIGGGAILLPLFAPSMNEGGILLANGLFQAVVDGVSVLFMAGLIFMGVKRAAGSTINWRMIFYGFRITGRIILATVLQTIFILLGLLLLVLPGIYLAIGYTMTFPLIVDRDYSPWQAMEASRKAVHRVWWKIAALFLLMGLIFLVSMIPLGLGLIWTWPMFVLMFGVVYRYLFGSERVAE